MEFKKTKYLILTIVTICCGLLSRKISLLPLYIGDALYGVMIYFIIRFISITKSMKKDMIISYVICVGIEASQLYQADWINSIRGTVLGRLVLGQGFLWSDILAYIMGILLMYFIDINVINRSSKKTMDK